MRLSDGEGNIDFLCFITALWNFSLLLWTLQICWVPGWHLMKNQWAFGFSMVAPATYWLTPSYQFNEGSSGGIKIYWSVVKIGSCGYLCTIRLFCSVNSYSINIAFFIVSDCQQMPPSLTSLSMYLQWYANVFGRVVSQCICSHLVVELVKGDSPSKLWWIIT